MRAILLKIQVNPSKKTGGEVYQLMFKDVDTGESYSTWVDTGFRNYENWRGLMSVQTVLDNLRVVKKGLIDADSRPILVEPKDILPGQLSIVEVLKEGGSDEEAIQHNL